MPHLIPTPPPQTQAPPQTPPPESASRDETPHHAIIEYGTFDVIKDNDGPFYTYIRYPKMGNAADEVISEWIRNFYITRVLEFEFLQLEEPYVIGEINMHFDSYLIDNRYTGILVYGEYSYALTTEPNEISKTFNIDLSRNIFLENNDILDPTQIESILELLYDRILIEYPDMYGYLGILDASWLRHLVIGHDGLIVVLEHFMVRPEIYETLTVTLPYDGLGSALLIRGNPPLDQAPPSVPVNTPPPFDDPPPLDGDEPIPDPPRQSSTIDTSRPIIALTFDDGPGNYLDQILDLLEQYNIRVTFYVLGNLVDTQSEALIRAVGMGSEVVGHSWDHKNMAKMSADDVSEQILYTSNTIEAVTDMATPVFRPPFGAVSDTMREVAAELGFAIVNWSVDSEDWNTNDVDAIFNAVMQEVSDGSIILSHEIYGSTLEAFTRLIPELLLKGFQFVTVSELLHHTHGELTPGYVYYNAYDGYPY
jgi:peptidoglycan/xylan/chitin deacetylase (PgdA/CDA1 family)